MPLQTFTVSKNNRRSCGICYKHNKNPNTCPSLNGDQCITIAGFQCGYCKEFGHTLKHCKVLKSNKEVAERSRKDQNSWKLMTLDEYRARGAKVAEPAKQAAEDDGFQVVKSRGRKKNTQSRVDEPIAVTKNGFSDLPEVVLKAPVEPPKAQLTQPQKAAAAAWGTFTKRSDRGEEVPGWLLPNPEPQSKVLNQVADSWIEKHNAGFMPPCPLNPREPELICTSNLKTGATKFAPGKSWADLEDDDSPMDPNDPWFQ